MQRGGGHWGTRAQLWNVLALPPSWANLKLKSISECCVTQIFLETNPPCPDNLKFSRLLPSGGYG
jgi:hypothetical protein